MARQLPPLNAIRAFEVAARHLSFTKAAQELHVTQAAVSHQIKVLEDALGVVLFERRNNMVLLTEAGQVGLPGIHDSFERLAAAIERIRTAANGDMLCVTTTPGFAAKWLVPRLERFRVAHPDIEVRIDASTHVVDLARESVDVCIRFGTGIYAGLDSERLFEVEVFPVCSPRLLGGPHPLSVPDDLRWQTLLHTNWSALDDTTPNWRMWLLAAGVRDVDWRRGPQFTETGVAIQAAIEGQGVLLGRSALVNDDLVAGRLVKLFGVQIASQFSYHLAYLPAALRRPRVVAFRDWLLNEVQIAKTVTAGTA